MCRSGKGAMLGLLMVAMMPAPVLAAGCGAARPPALTVVSDLPPPNYRHALTRQQISAMTGRGSMDHSHAGLTKAQSGISLKPVLAFQRMADGSVCATLQQVEVTWRMVQLQVDIAVEYRPGSCAYGEIVRHENQHVAIAQRAFAAADRALRQEFAQVVRGFPPFMLHTTPQQAANEVAARLMAAARPIIDRYDRDSSRENAAIDTPESYRQVSARCRDW